MNLIIAALPGIISSLTLGVLGYAWHKLKDVKEQRDQEDVERNQKMDCIVIAIRNNIKAELVLLYEKVTDRGYITPLELDIANRLFDSYKALGGNHYIHALISRMNTGMKVVGEALPED